MKYYIVCLERVLSYNIEENRTEVYTSIGSIEHRLEQALKYFNNPKYITLFSLKTLRQIRHKLIYEKINMYGMEAVDTKSIRYENYFEIKIWQPKN